MLISNQKTIEISTQKIMANKNTRISQIEINIIIR